jgi:hypothetical protein
MIAEDRSIIQHFSAPFENKKKREIFNLSPLLLECQSRIRPLMRAPRQL